MRSNQNCVTVTGVKDFDAGETLESGQTFRFLKTGDGAYTLRAGRRTVYITYNAQSVTFYPCDADDGYWFNYFDLNTDYGTVKNALTRGDPIMEKAVNYARGIRLLNQEPWECIASFIVSQNNNIPRIKRIIENLSAQYGEKTEDGFAFPSPERLLNASIDGLMACNTGFRAKYLLDAASKVKSGVVSLNASKARPTEDIKKELLAIYGVGEKVADCALLFAFGRRDIFPVDVWMKRVMREMYFNGAQTPDADIQAFAHTKFGDFAGYAQQYLYHYARTSGYFK
jgi:N-glycosylase/DNA lyase